MQGTAQGKGWAGSSCEMKTLLIGIDPPEEIAKEIKKLKKRVLEVCGEQQLVHEFPHATFLINRFTDGNRVNDALDSIASESKPIDLEIDGIKYFPPEQSGTWMIHAAIKKAVGLENLQT